MHKYCTKDGALEMAWNLGKWVSERLQSTGYCRVLIQDCLKWVRELAVPESRSSGCREMFKVCAFYVFLRGTAFYIHLCFSWVKSHLRKSEILLCSNSSLILQSCWNKFTFSKQHCSRIDCTPGYTASHSPASGFSSIQDISKPASHHRHEAKDLFFYLSKTCQETKH